MKIVITSLGARPDVNEAIHSYGGVVLHDVINVAFARKAIEKGADGLIAVAAGAGGHAGTWSPFALVQEIRAWFDGPLALSGAIANGRAVLAARAMGADFGYVGSAFIATREARASDAYKQSIVASSAQDIVYTNLFTGVHGNYLRAVDRARGLDPENLPQSDPSKMDFGAGRPRRGATSGARAKGSARSRTSQPPASWSRVSRANTTTRCARSRERRASSSCALAAAPAVALAVGRACGRSPSQFSIGHHDLVVLVEHVDLERERAAVGFALRTAVVDDARAHAQHVAGANGKLPADRSQAR